MLNSGTFGWSRDDLMADTLRYDFTNR